MTGGDYDHANNRRPHNFSARKIIISNEFGIDLYIITLSPCQLYLNKVVSASLKCFKKIFCEML